MSDTNDRAQEQNHSDYDVPNLEFAENDDGTYSIGDVVYRPVGGREAELKAVIDGRGGVARLSQGEVDRFFVRE